jgi:hypothetical protein
MTDPKQKQQKGFNSAAAIVTGAVVGVGVAVAGIVALKDEKNRKKVRDVLTNVKNQATDYMEDMQKNIQDKKKEVEGKLEVGKEKAEKVEKIVKE